MVSLGLATPSISWMVLRQGRILDQHSFGWADLEAPALASPSTNYRLASVSKQFTAAAILSLVDGGALALDTSAARILPGLPAGITVHHLLTHHSGLADYEDHLPEGTHQVLDADVVAILRGRPLVSPPGAQYAYSNSGYAVLAQIVERITGEPYEDYLARRILRPAGLKNTVAHREGKDTVARRAYGYSPRPGGAWPRTDQSRTSAVLGDGGVYSSLEDLALWIQALEDKRILKPETHNAAWTAQAGPYGFGYFVKPDRVWHTGETIGFRSAMLFDRPRGVTAVVLSNRSNLKTLEVAERLVALHG